MINIVTHLCLGKDKEPSPLWTAIYSTHDAYCFWIKFGHSKGMPIKPETAVLLAKNRLKHDPRRLRELHWVLPGGPRRWRL